MWEDWCQRQKKEKTARERTQELLKKTARERTQAPWKETARVRTQEPQKLQLKGGGFRKSEKKRSGKGRIGKRRKK